MKRNLFGIMLLSGISILPKANAQTTYEEMEQLLNRTDLLEFPVIFFQNGFILVV